MTPDEERYLAGYKELALRESIAKDEALAEVAKLRERLAAPPPGTVTPKAAAPAAAPAPPPPPPAPALPPPARPASITAFHALPEAERNRVAEFYGGAEKLDAEFEAEFRNRLRVRSGGGFRDDRRTSMQILQDREAAPATFDAEAWAMRPPSRSIPGAAPMTAAEAQAVALANAMNQRGTGAPRTATPTPAVPRAADGTFQPRGRTKDLPHFSR